MKFFILLKISLISLLFMHVSSSNLLTQRGYTEINILAEKKGEGIYLINNQGSNFNVIIKEFKGQAAPKNLINYRIQLYSNIYGINSIFAIDDFATHCDDNSERYGMYILQAYKKKNGFSDRAFLLKKSMVTIFMKDITFFDIKIVRDLNLLNKIEIRKMIHFYYSPFNASTQNTHL